jgi:hypothetical protein
MVQMTAQLLWVQMHLQEQQKTLLQLQEAFQNTNTVDQCFPCPQNLSMQYGTQPFTG